MKAKMKLHKLLSLLLTLVMLLSLVPAMGVTALAAGSYPDANVVSVDDGKAFAEPGYYYFKNGASACSNDPTNYNAYYNPSTGTLTLDGYDGGSITAGGTDADITVVLKGTNTINGNLVNSRGGDITITSESGGTLSITNTLSGSNSAIGIEAGLSGSYDTGNVTIMGDAKVTISVTNNNSNIDYAAAYGIFAKENITISENASVDITCATPNNTYSNIYCNGLRADKNVTINTDGTIKINVIAAGDDGTQSYGIYPMGKATLTKVGEMEVQWKKHSTNSNYPGGAVLGGATFSETDYAINEDTTNCYASYRHGTPRTVTVENGTLTGPGVKYANGSGYFLAGDKVNITPAPKAGKSGEIIPFQKWTSDEVTFTDPTTENNSFTVPGKDVTVTATHSPFVGTPTFTPIGTTGTQGTLTFTTKVTLGDGNESFALVKEAEVDDTTKYKSINPSTTSLSSPYEYSSTVNFNNFPAGNYYVAEKLNGAWYPSEKFTVNYTAAPTVTYPDHVRVFNASGNTTSLSDKQYLAANDAANASDGYDGTQTYVARYDKSSGTLYLKDYHGIATHDMIFANGDLNIVVESDSSFTTSTTATGNLYGIQAGGKLNISGSGKLTVTAKGRGNVYGISAKEGVTISAPLDVRVGKNNVAENGSLYGIYAQSGAISLDGNDMIVTATGGTEKVYGVYNAADTSTTITDNGNIGISGTLTVNLSNGSYNRGISSQGGVITLDGATVKIPGSYYYGIFNDNGNVVIKSTSDVDISSDISNNNGICTDTGGDLTIENSTVKVSANGFAAEIKGNVSIKDSTVELTRTSSYYEVIRTGNSSAANTIDLSTEGSVTLTASGEQTNYAMITGKVTLGPNTKCEMGKPDGNSYDGAYDAASDKTVLKFVHETAAPAATVNDVTIDGTTGTAIADKEVIITLANDTFASTLSGSWITNLPAGLSQSVSRTDDTHAKITVSGNPTATSSDALAIKIPAANLVTSTSDLDVTSNANAKYNITAPATPITDTLVPVTDLTGKTYNESAQEPTFGGSLIRDTDYTVSYAVKSGFSGTLNSDGKPVGAGTYVVTVAGKGSYTGSFTEDFKIDKADPVYTAPTAKTGLAYTGSALDLIDAGTVTKGGEMQYKLDGGSYSTTIPTATDAGDYTVHFKIVENNNYNAVAETQVGSGAINIAQAEWGTPTETLTPVNPTTAGGNEGKITGTTNAMQYKKSDGSTWKDCTGDVTGLTAGTYYVRYKADSNHTASDTNYKTVTLTDPGATLYGVTVTDGTASPSGDQAAGTEVTITANTKTGFNFKEWTGLNDSDYKTGFTKASNPATFIMPASAVNVTATYDPAALTGTVNITGTLKYGEELTASLASTNNTGTLTYKWYRSGETAEIANNTTGKYTLVEDDIGKTITVAITSNVQTGEITGTTTGTIDRADGPAAPSAFTLTFTPNADGTTFTATIPAFAGGEYSFDGATYSTTNTKTNCAANTSYTGYARVKETATHKTGTEISDTQTSPKLTVATPTFTPNGASGFTGTQSVTISCTTAGAKIYYTTDGTTPTTASTLYTTALSLTSTTTVKAIAVNAGMNDSAIATATFTKYSGGGGGGGGSYTPSYTVSVDKTENGTITVSPKSASKGDAVTITVKPDKGYELEDLTVLDSKGKELALTEKNGKYSFKMPSGKVEVKATFIKEAEISPFDDVSTNAYYYEAVKWAAEKGITGGVGNGLFAPNQPCTRAQIVTFLWRAAGSPAPKNMSSFADVPADAFYAKAVAWAVENGITGGTGDGKFSPDATCTRAQAVTFLYRASGSPAVSSKAEFSDVSSTAFYADAVAWAAKKDITTGIGGGLFGADNDCTRAQIVTFLYRSVK